MTKTARHLGAALLVLALVGSGSLAAAGETDLEKALETGRQWKAKVTSLQRTRDNAVGEALTALRDGRGPLKLADPRLHALKIVAILRAPEAVPLLIPAISLREPLRLRFDRTISQQYPVVDALVVIGKPAARACLSELAKNSVSDDAREKLCWVVGEVEGQAVGRFLIKSTLTQERDDAAKQRLSKALLTYERLFPIASQGAGRGSDQVRTRQPR